jgi:transposase
VGERIAQLGEQFRLVQSKRFAPSSEKLKDRVFDEAEQIVTAEPDHAAGGTDNTFARSDTAYSGDCDQGFRWIAIAASERS